MDMVNLYELDEFIRSELDAIDESENLVEPKVIVQSGQMGELKLNIKLGQRGGGLITILGGHLCRPIQPKEENAKVQYGLDHIQEEDGQDFPF